MTMRKIAVTVPEDVLRSAKRSVARGAAKTLSAYVSTALKQQAMVDELDVMLAAMLAETGGPLSKAEEERALVALYGKSPSTPRTRARAK